uniref:RNA-directed RNA polymerase n=1 Tax=Bactrocera jarvisi toti-like virus 1 TaxID=2814076 RepID=A0A8J9RY07_9VIRU|nr:7734 [Bactrocera jarvisi toti-like virus 1]
MVVGRICGSGGARKHYQPALYERGFSITGLTYRQWRDEWSRTFGQERRSGSSVGYARTWCSVRRRCGSEETDGGREQESGDRNAFAGLAGAITDACLSGRRSKTGHRLEFGGRKGGAEEYSQAGRRSSGGWCEPRQGGENGCNLDWGTPAEIKTEEDWSLQEGLAAIEQEGSEIGLNGKCNCGGEKGVNAELNEFNVHLQRFRITEHKRCHGCGIGAGTLEDGVHILLRGAHKTARDFISKLYSLAISSKASRCKCLMQKYFKKQSAILKLGGKYIHEDWRWGVHWEMFYGYTPYRGVEHMLDEVEQWLVFRRILGGELEEAEYLKMMSEETLRLCREEWHLPKKCLGIEEWVATGEWMRGRSGDGVRNEVQINGKKMKTRRMKSVDAVFRSDRDMGRSLRRITDETFQVMEKSEGAKVRPVVKTGSEMFRKMDFLSQWVEDGFGQSKLSTLFGGVENQEDIDSELMASAENSALWKVPLDQSNFDWHQNRLSVEVVVATLGIALSKQVDNPDFHCVWETMWDSLFSREVRVVAGSAKYEWGNGLPSGLRWTALLDTILNITSFRVAVRLASGALKREIPIHCHKSQGDDIAFSSANLEDVKYIIHIYNRLGYEAHPAKTFYSRYRTEFLRKSYENGLGITGYICRSLLSIRFRNPILDLAVEKATRVYSRLTTWHLLGIRGMKSKAVAEMFIADCEQMGVSAEHAAGYALCKASFGGAGLLPSSQLGRALVRWFKVPYTYEVVVNEKKISPYLGQWNGRIAEKCSRYLSPHNYEHLYKSLSLSWGIREIDLLGKVYIVWKECKLSPLYIGPCEESAPEPEGFWRLEGLPTMVRNDVKEGAIEKDNWTELVKPECVDWLRRMQKRVSKTVFREYLLGRINAPWPIVDNVAMKYGQKIRTKFQRLLRSYVLKKDVGILEICRISAALEERISSALMEMGKRYTYGV